MSSPYDKSQFEIGLPDLSVTEPSSFAPNSDAGMMRDLHRASATVLRLATRAHDAVARGDTAGAQAARASLEKQLALTTRLIDALMFDGTHPHTTH